MIALLSLALLSPAPANDAQIRWSPPGAIFVTVVNRDLSPLPGVAVTAERAGAPESESTRRVTTGVGGRAEFRSLPAGSYTVRVSAPGHLEMAFGPMPIEEGEAPSVRLPVILAVVNPIMTFAGASR